MTSHRERVRPVKERVGSSARDGDGEGGTNDVNASRILGFRLGRPAGFVAVPSDMPYLMYLLKKAIVSGCAYPPVSNERGTSVPYGKS